MSEQIVLYGTRWCGDCFVAKRVLKQHGVDYTEIDIENDPAARQHVQDINGGYKSTPTIIFPSGAVIVEPSRRELEDALRREGLIPAA